MPRDTEQDYVTFESLGITLESPSATPVPIRNLDMCPRDDIQARGTVIFLDTTGEGGKSGDSFALDAPVTFDPLGWVIVEEEQTERPQQGSMLWRLTPITGACWSQDSAKMQ